MGCPRSGTTDRRAPNQSIAPSSISMRPAAIPVTNVGACRAAAATGQSSLRAGAKGNCSSGAGARRRSPEKWAVDSCPPRAVPADPAPLAIEPLKRGTLRHASRPQQALARGHRQVQALGPRPEKRELVGGDVSTLRARLDPSGRPRRRSASTSTGRWWHTPGRSVKCSGGMRSNFSAGQCKANGELVGGPDARTAFGKRHLMFRAEHRPPLPCFDPPLVFELRTSRRRRRSTQLASLRITMNSSLNRAQISQCSF